MKDPQKGFMVPLFLVIIVILAAGVTYTYYKQGLGYPITDGPPGKIKSDVQAAPGIFSLSQPDGSKIDVYARGDERVSWMETTEGYSISRSTDGYWYYVSGDLILTNVKANLPPPKNLVKHIR